MIEQWRVDDDLLMRYICNNCEALSSTVGLYLKPLDTEDKFNRVIEEFVLHTMHDQNPGWQISEAKHLCPKCRKEH